MARVLVVALDRRQKALRRLVESRGHRVRVEAPTDAVRTARADRPKVVLLTEAVPRRDALDICKALKFDVATAHIAVFLLANVDDPIDRAVARELGADAFLVSPEPGALAQQIDDAIADQGVARGHLAAGAVTLDEDGHEVRVDGEPIGLTSLETTFLLALSDGAERVHTRAELKERVWGDEGRGDVRLVDQYVKRLRKKLGRAGRTIQTVRGVGYRFVATLLGGAKRAGRGRGP